MRNRHLIALSIVALTLLAFAAGVGYGADLGVRLACEERCDLARR